MSDKNPELELDEAKVRALIGMVSGDGYQAILDVMEWYCNRSENKLIGIHPSLKDEVLAEHAIVHAQRVYFQEVVSYIDTVIEKETGLRKNNQRFTVEEEDENLMSALPLTEE